jgi:hypothetical protein
VAAHPTDPLSVFSEAAAALNSRIAVREVEASAAPAQAMAQLVRDFEGQHPALASDRTST